MPKRHAVSEFSSAEFGSFGSGLLVRYGFLDAKAGFGGFGLRRLVSQVFLGAKAANETGIFFPEFSSAEFGGFGSGLLVRYGFLDAKAGFVGFGSRLLVSQGFLGAKAGHSDRAARRVEESFSALVKQGKTYFFKSSQTSRERRFGIEILMPCANALCQNCKKLRFLRYSAFAEFCDSLPVFLWRDFGGFTKNNKVCVFYWGKICFFSFLSIFCLQEN